MRHALLALALLASPHAITAQTARVVELTPAEATEARTLNQQQAETERKLDALTARIKAAHEAENPWLRYSILDFSADYRFVVPVPDGPLRGNYGCNTGWLSGATPAAEQPLEWSRHTLGGFPAYYPSRAVTTTDVTTTDGYPYPYAYVGGTLSTAGDESLELSATHAVSKPYKTRLGHKKACAKCVTTYGSGK